MVDKKYYWLKLKRDFFKRHDIRIIEAMPNGKDYILFYLKLLLESIDHEGALRFSDAIPYNEQMLSVITNTNIDIVKSAMEIFLGLNMIEVFDDRTIYMNEVDKLIGSESASAERVRKHRENTKLLTDPKSNAERQNNFRAKKSCEEKQHIPFIEDYINNKRYGGNYYIVIKRDKYKCAICGSIENLCVHHIDGYDENKPENNTKNKMVTLCRCCHSNVHTGENVPSDILDSIDYFINSNEMLLSNTDVTKCNTEIDKDLNKDIDKEKKEPSPPAPPSGSVSQEFENLWSLYPRKEGKKTAFASYQRAKKKGVTFEDVKSGIINYLDYIKAKKIEPKFIKQGSTWFNGEHWNDEYDYSASESAPHQQTNSNPFLNMLANGEEL